MKRRSRARPARSAVVAGVAFALAMLALVCGTAHAERDAGKKKRVSFTVSEYAYKKLERAHELLAADDYAGAKKEVDQLAGRRGLNSHERALVEQTYGYVASAQEDYATAAAAFERCLALDALPEGAQLNTRYNLAQLYLALERYDKAIVTLKAWFGEAENPAPQAYYLLAAAYMQAEQPQQALEPARRAVEASSAPKEPWLQLLLALRLQRKEYGEARKLLEELVTRFGGKAYWLQLSSVYAELGREEDALAAMQVAYELGLLDRDSELRNLARMYLYHEIPYRAAMVMEKALAEGVAASDPEAWELLADAWLSAREFDEAIEPLGKAAQASDDGKLYVRLGQLQMERQQWHAAATAFAQALAKGGLPDRGKVALLLGIAHYSGDRLTQARRAFEKAREIDGQREEAERWLAYLERLEQQRRRLAQKAE